MDRYENTMKIQLIFLFPYRGYQTGLAEREGEGGGGVRVGGSSEDGGSGGHTMSVEPQ